MSGWDVAECFREVHPNVAVVYASGMPVEGVRQVPDSIFFNKPYQIAAILDACRRLGEDARRNSVLARAPVEFG